MRKSGKFHAALLSAAMFVGAVSPAAGVLAADDGTWVQSGDLYWYQNADGTWPANTWAKINGKWYHFNGDGFMQSGWKKFDGIWYYLGAKDDGSMKTGWINDNGTYYYCDSAGKMLTGWKTINGSAYYFWPDGAMAKNTTVDGHTIGADGAVVTGQSTPIVNPTPVPDTNLNFNGTYIALIKEAIQKTNANQPGDYFVKPSAVYQAALDLAKETLSASEAEQFEQTMTRQERNMLDDGAPLSDKFYEYLIAAGYDYETNFKVIDKIVRDNIDMYIKQNGGGYGDGVIVGIVCMSGFSYAMVQAYLNQLAAEGLVSQNYAEKEFADIVFQRQAA